MVQILLKREHEVVALVIISKWRPIKNRDSKNLWESFHHYMKNRMNFQGESQEKDGLGRLSTFGEVVHGFKHFINPDSLFFLALFVFHLRVLRFKRIYPNANSFPFSSSTLCPLLGKKWHFHKCERLASCLASNFASRLKSQSAHAYFTCFCFFSINVNQA